MHRRWKCIETAFRPTNSGRLRHRSASCTTAYHFTAVYDGDVFVGLVLYWETEAYLYIEHAALAV